MGLNWRQFELGVLRPTLAEVASVMPAPEVAVKLVGETIWHESDRLRALGQYPRFHPDIPAIAHPDPFGPGLGIASIEEPTWDWMASTDAWMRLKGWTGWRYEQLAYDLRLNVIACRLRYFLDQRALPRLEDGMDARATYWWKVYNGGQVDRRPDYIRNAQTIPWSV